MDKKQKTGLALSLVNSPELLLLDEPTTGLDPNARRAIWEVIRGLKAKGKTIILTTHYLDEAQQLSDRVAIMDHGHIVAMGTTEEIIQQHGSGERLEIHGNEKLAEYIKANTELEVILTALSEGPYPSKKENRCFSSAGSRGRVAAPVKEKSDAQRNSDDVFVKLVSEPIGEQGETRTRKNQQETQAVNMVSGKRIYADFKVFSVGYLRNKFGLFFGLIFPGYLNLDFWSYYFRRGCRDS